MGNQRIETAKIKSLIKDERWEILMELLSRYVRELEGMEITGSNEFETLRNLHEREGKKKGVLEFFEKLDRQAFD